MLGNNMFQKIHELSITSKTFPWGEPNGKDRSSAARTLKKNSFIVNVFRTFQDPQNLCHSVEVVGGNQESQSISDANCNDGRNTHEREHESECELAVPLVAQPTQDSNCNKNESDSKGCKADAKQPTNFEGKQDSERNSQNPKSKVSDDHNNHNDLEARKFDGISSEMTEEARLTLLKMSAANTDNSFEAAAKADLAMRTDGQREGGASSNTNKDDTNDGQGKPNVGQVTEQHGHDLHGSLPKDNHQPNDLDDGNDSEENCHEQTESKDHDGKNGDHCGGDKGNDGNCNNEEENVQEIEAESVHSDDSTVEETMLPLGLDKVLTETDLLQHEREFIRSKLGDCKKEK